MGKPSICILYCGGIVDVEKAGLTGTLGVEDRITEELMNLEPKLKDNYGIGIVFLENMESADMAPEHWKRIAEEIWKNYKKYDGFVVVQGMDAISHSASALSFALQEIGKPVVLTGARLMADEAGSDAKGNLTNAVKVACMGISGVLVVFKSRIISGARVTAATGHGTDAFETFGGGDLGEIGAQIRWSSSPPKRHAGFFAAKAEFGGEVPVMTIEPGTTQKQMENIVKSGIRGLVLLTYGSGRIPARLVPALEIAREMEIPVLVTTQHGIDKQGLGASDSRAILAGAIEAFDMSLESAAAKLHWLIGQKTPYEEIKRLMRVDLCGEIVQNGKA